MNGFQELNVLCNIYCVICVTLNFSRKVLRSSKEYRPSVYIAYSTLYYIGNILHYISHHKYSMRTYLKFMVHGGSTTWGCLLTFLARNTQSCEKYVVQISLHQNKISKAYVFVINQMKCNNNKIIANRNQTNEIQNNAKAL